MSGRCHSFVTVFSKGKSSIVHVSLQWFSFATFTSRISFFENQATFFMQPGVCLTPAQWVVGVAGANLNCLRVRMIAGLPLGQAFRLYTHINSDINFQFISLVKSGLWKGIPMVNPSKHRRNRQTTHRKVPLELTTRLASYLLAIPDCFLICCPSTGCCRKDTIAIGNKIFGKTIHTKMELTFLTCTFKPKLSIRI